MGASPGGSRAFREYKVSVITEGAFDTIFLGSSALPVKRIEKELNEAAEEGRSQTGYMRWMARAPREEGWDVVGFVWRHGDGRDYSERRVLTFLAYCCAPALSTSLTNTPCSGE